MSEVAPAKQVPTLLKEPTESASGGEMRLQFVSWSAKNLCDLYPMRVEITHLPGNRRRAAAEEQLII